MWTPRGGAENYYGIEATIDVYGFNLQPCQLSASGIWIVNKGDGKPSSLSGIQFGWHVSYMIWRAVCILVPLYKKYY